MTRVLRLTLLAPDIIEAIIGGQQGLEISLTGLMEPFSVGWRNQAEHFGQSSGQEYHEPLNAPLRQVVASLQCSFLEPDHCVQDSILDPKWARSTDTPRPIPPQTGHIFRTAYRRKWAVLSSDPVMNALVIRGSQRRPEPVCKTRFQQTVVDLGHVAPS
ncbi:hypothetical protein [Roseovarius sp. Pro17]|uniref:hypothetical protein n=1 Tax=Roseovarius sp. Pro17 TaxID=3108175 RepID=UPI002D78E03E|nr:hypothetical protein [Roseovarius sp. Pro17]